MAMIHKYTLLCDEVRQEMNGKFIVLGLYTPDIVVPVVPFALPSLTFFVVAEADAPTIGEFSFKLTQHNSDAVLAGGSGKLQVQQAGHVALPLRLGPLQMPAAGRYTFTLDVSGSGTITHEFSVILRLQQMGQPVPPSGVH